jgi:CrcB protein
VAEKLTGQAPWLRPFAIVGVLGGWTTYSTLAVDAVLLAKGGHPALTVGYLAATVLGGIAIVVVGNALGRQVVGS